MEEFGSVLVHVTFVMDPACLFIGFSFAFRAESGCYAQKPYLLKSPSNSARRNLPIIACNSFVSKL